MKNGHCFQQLEFFSTTPKDQQNPSGFKINLLKKFLTVCKNKIENIETIKDKADLEKILKTSTQMRLTSEKLGRWYEVILQNGLLTKVNRFFFLKKFFFFKKNKKNRMQFKLIFQLGINMMMLNENKCHNLKRFQFQ